ncbi:MAG TPA: glycosyltransferase family 1 protein [Candidatus Saccharimonas sp.]|nr:glycosyltransferase family 1 protein [Candidatus Saccharimonas sp.]
MSQGTIWLDLTILVNWKGHLTGIQRVEYNLAKRYAELPNVKFCVFHKESNKLAEFDFAHVDHKFQALQQQTTPPIGEEVSPATVARPLYRRALSKARRVAGQLVSPEAKAFLRGQLHRSDAKETPVVFKPGDIFFITSGDWSGKEFANLIIKEREKTGLKVYLMVHDMLPAILPGYFVPGMDEQFVNYMKRMFAHCDGVMTTSQSSKKDILQFVKDNHLPKIKVGMFRLGDDFVKTEPIKPAIDVTKDKFILYVSTIEGRKNHMALYYAAREAQRRGYVDFPKVVLVGKRGWLSNDFAYIVEKDPVLSKKFIFTRPSDQELAWLYKNCLVTVFPSFYEGWGLMITESLAFGKMCLSSDQSSMPEIGGDLVDYFSPSDPVSMMEKIMHYVKNPRDLQAKEAKIKKDYKITTWDDSFQQVQAAIKGMQKD